jgi:hypothetical protein
MTAASLVALALVMGGCQNESAPLPGAASAASAEPAVAAGGGLADPSNDAAVVALAKKALACEWKNAGFKYDCPDLKAWKEAELLKKGANDKTLVNMLGDADEKVRWLSATGLSSHGLEYRKDKALASALVTAAEKETFEANGSTLGSALSRIDLKATGLTDRVKKIISGHKLEALRRSVAGSVLFNNKEEGDFFGFLQELARNKEEKAGVRRAAVAAFWTGTPQGKHEDACKFWLEMADDDEQEVAGEAAYMCAFYPHNDGCTGQWDALLDLIENKSKAGEVNSPQVASALNYLHDQKKVSPAQKTRTLAVAKTLAENAKNGGSARARALEFVGKKDPAGRTYAAKFENDQEFFVKSTAKRIQEGK